MSIDVGVFDGPDALSEATERQLGRGRPLLSTSWLRAAPLPGELRLLVAHRGGRAVAALPLFRISAPASDFDDPRALLCGARVRALAAAAGHPTAGFEALEAREWYPAALSAVPYAYRGGVLGSCDDTELVGALAQEARALCRREGVRTCLHGFLYDENDSDWIKALRAQGARPVLLGAHAELTIAWETLEEYFRWLGRRKVRQEFTAHARALGVEHQRLEREPMESFPREIAAEVLELFSASSRRRGDEPPMGLHHALLEAWPARRVLFMGRDGTRIRSALLCLEGDRVLYPKVYGSFRRNHDYFGLVFRELLCFALASGARRIEYGGGSHQAKLHRGASLRWVLGMIETYDGCLREALNAHVPALNAALVGHFSDLCRRFGRGHVAPNPSPVILEMSVTG